MTSNQELKSDHPIVTISLKICSTESGPWLYKINASLVKEKEFLDQMNDIIKEATDKYNTENTAIK